MKKYSICIDYKAASKRGLEFRAIEAKNVLEAIAEADRAWSDEIYLMHIMEQDGKTYRPVKGRNGYNVTPFKAVLTRRSNGWHPTDEEHFEQPFTVKHFQNRFFDYFEIA